MKFSKQWLEEYLSKPIPSDEQVVETLSLYAFEVEGAEKTALGDTVFDVKVLPNRAGDCLCHRGLARELSALLEIPLKNEAVVEVLPANGSLPVTFDEGVPCKRYIGAVMEGVKVGPSPEWLSKRLEAIGQRSINNVVDATNYIMLSYGQPMHAFDVARLSSASIRVRMAEEGEKFVTLSDEEKTLDPKICVIADGGNGEALALAGVKGGKAAAIDELTHTILLESASFEASAVRYTSRSRQILSDSAKRFEADLTSEIALEAMERCIDLIKQLAGGTVGACNDVYTQKEPKRIVALRADKVRSFSGLNIKDSELETILVKRGLPFEKAIPREMALKHLEPTLGAPYVWDPSVEFVCPACFDCSALAAWIYWMAGVWIPPRKSCDQLVYTEEVSQADMRPGDLIFSNTHDGKIRYETEDWMAGTPIPKGVDHVGIYVGDGEVIHATRQYGKVVREKLADNPKKWGDIVKVGKVPGVDDESYLVSIPTYRKDLRTEEDLIEEVMQQYGYNNLEAHTGNAALAALTEQETKVLAIRLALESVGFNACYTYAFRNSGVVELENPIASDKAFMRENLSDGMREALVANIQYMDLAGVSAVSLYELGKAFPASGEELFVCIGCTDGTKKGKIAEQKLAQADEILAILGVSLKEYLKEGVAQFPFSKIDAEAARKFVAAHPHTASSEVIRYTPFSPFPPLSRDVALFAPEADLEASIADTIAQNAGPLARTVRLFDRFQKSPTENSYGFRIVLQADDRTLTDSEANEVLSRVTAALVKKGYTIR